MDRGVVYTTSKSRNRMRSRNFESLAWLIGQPLKISGLTYHGGYEPDGIVQIIADYPDTVLIDLEFVISRWGLQIEPRHIKTMINKAAIVCGDVKISRVNGGPVTVDEVSKLETINWHREEDEIL